MVASYVRFCIRVPGKINAFSGGRACSSEKDEDESREEAVAWGHRIASAAFVPPPNRMSDLDLEQISFLSRMGRRRFFAKVRPDPTSELLPTLARDSYDSANWSSTVKAWESFLRRAREIFQSNLRTGGGEGSRTPVLEAVDTSLYMLSR